MWATIQKIGLLARNASGWAVIAAVILSGTAPLYAAVKGLPGPVILDIWLGAIAALLLIAFVALKTHAHFSLRKFRRKPEYEKWDAVPWLADWQAACLWDDIEPYSPLADRTPSYPTLQMLKSAAIDGLLGQSKTYPNEGWERYSRENLRNFARSKDIRPISLFPEVREGGGAVVAQSTSAAQQGQSYVETPLPLKVAALSLDKLLYVGRHEISIDKLLSDYEIRFDVIAYNASAFPIAFGSLNGAIRYRIDGQPTYTKLHPMHFLKMHFTDPVLPYAEFVMELSQHVSGLVANDIADALARGAKIEFELLELHVTVQSADDANITGIVPLWSGILCAKFGERVVTTKLLYVSAGASSSAKVSLS